MDLLKEHNKKYQFFVDITGIAMKVYNKYHYGLLESAYEAAMRYLLEQDGYKVERQENEDFGQILKLIFDRFLTK